MTSEMAEWRKRPCPECGVGPGAYCRSNRRPKDRFTPTPHKSRKGERVVGGVVARVVLGEGYPDLSLETTGGGGCIALKVDGMRYAQTFEEKLEPYVGRRVRLVVEVINEAER